MRGTRELDAGQVWRVVNALRGNAPGDRRVKENKEIMPSLPPGVEMLLPTTDLI